MLFGSMLVIKFGGHALIDKECLRCATQCAIMEIWMVLVLNAL